MADVGDAVTALQKVVATQSQPVSRFNTEIVRSAWGLMQRKRREALRAARAAAAASTVSGYDSDEPQPADVPSDPMCYAYIEQLWTDHIIVRLEDARTSYLRIPFIIDAPGTSTDNVRFGKAEPVQQAYVAASAKRGSDALSQLVALRNVSPKERESLKGKGHTLPGTKSYPIKTLSDLDNAIQAYGRSKPEDRSRLKAHLRSEAKRLNASQATIDRINNLGKSSSVKATALDTGLVALATVRTQAGSRRYRKPIGAPLGGAPGGQTLANVARTGSLQGAGITADKLRDSISAVSKEKTYKGGKVFGDIGNKGKLKSALAQIAKLPDGKRGEAAAEVVKAAQALGLTSLVPTEIKRLYRQYIAQGTIKSPSKPSAAKS